MINHIELTAFKCFEELSLPLKELTLLSGMNASGKSTVLQALVLLHQTMNEHEWSKRLMLNGKSIRLGTVLDVVSEQAGGRIFTIGLKNSKDTIKWSFCGDKDENRSEQQSMEVYHIKIEDDSPHREATSAMPFYRHLYPVSFDSKIDYAPKPLIDDLRSLVYITAERIGPREIYPLEDKQVAPVVGTKGEHTVSILYGSLRSPIALSELKCEGEERNTLLHQATAWMQQFFPECELEVEKVVNANALTLRLRTTQGGNFHLPTNVGFGLTQVLPIVVAALSAKKGGLLLIENPEVHLHPAGQALIGQFLGRVADAGVQVILETHSDHVLNGVRRFVKTGGIAPEKVALHFFRASAVDAPQVESPKINKQGRIDDWPDGFFDEWDKALFELV